MTKILKKYADSANESAMIRPIRFVYRICLLRRINTPCSPLPINDIKMSTRIKLPVVT